MMLDLQAEEGFRTGLGWSLSAFVHVGSESWSREKVPTTQVPDLPIPGSRPGMLPALWGNGTSQHPSNKCLLLASAVGAGSCSLQPNHP